MVTHSTSIPDDDSRVFRQALEDIFSGNQAIVQPVYQRAVTLITQEGPFQNLPGDIAARLLPSLAEIIQQHQTRADASSEANVKRHPNNVMNRLVQTVLQPTHPEIAGRLKMEAAAWNAMSAEAGEQAAKWNMRRKRSGLSAEHSPPLKCAYQAIMMQLEHNEHLFRDGPTALKIKEKFASIAKWLLDEAWQQPFETPPFMVGLNHEEDRLRLMLKLAAQYPTLGADEIDSWLDPNGVELYGASRQIVNGCTIRPVYTLGEGDSLIPFDHTTSSETHKDSQTPDNVIRTFGVRRAEQLMQDRPSSPPELG